jgi:single-stranded DNA-binding protein
MSQIKATFTGGIVAEPEAGTTPSGATRLSFPVYVNHTKKNKDTGAYDKTGDVSKIRVTLWGDLAANADFQKGDLVEVVATLVEKEFQKKDGTMGRSLQTDYIESVIVKHRSDGASNNGGGFADDEAF